MFRRGYSSVGPALKSAKAIRDLLAAPSWSSAEFLKAPSNTTTKITPALVQRLSKLSGLPAELSPAEAESFLHALKAQVSFLDHLHAAEITLETPDLRFARILKHVPEALGLEDLEQQVAEMTPSIDRGEVEGHWSPLDLASLKDGSNYVVRGGLGKDD